MTNIDKIGKGTRYFLNIHNYNTYLRVLYQIIHNLVSFLIRKTKIEKIKRSTF